MACGLRALPPALRGRKRASAQLFFIVMKAFLTRMLRALRRRLAIPPRSLVSGPRSVRHGRQRSRPLCAAMAPATWSPSHEASAHAVLRQHWGYGTFRPAQLQAIKALVGGQDALVVLATGAGKSLVYQVREKGSQSANVPFAALQKRCVFSSAAATATCSRRL